MNLKAKLLTLISNKELSYGKDSFLSFQLMYLNIVLFCMFSLSTGLLGHSLITTTEGKCNCLTLSRKISVGSYKQG